VKAGLPATWSRSSSLERVLNDQNNSTEMGNRPRLKSHTLRFTNIETAVQN